MPTAIKTYGVTETPPEHRRGRDRVFLATDDDTGDGFYIIQDWYGHCLMCDGSGAEVTGLSSWTECRVLGDIPEGNMDAFFEVVKSADVRGEPTR
jgi:hypothetical protein